MNITIQSCGLVVLLIIFYFYSGQKRMMLRTGKAFRKLIIGVIVGSIADIFSVFAIVYAERLPELLVIVSCKFYLICILYVAYSGLRYVLADAYGKQEVYDKIIGRYSILLMATYIAMIVAPIDYVCKNSGSVIYTEGPSVIITYFTACFFLVNIFYFLKVKKDKMNARRRKAVIVWMILWIAMATLQFITQFLLIVSFAGVLGVMIVYLMFENPETFIDRRTGLFNQNAMQQYVKELYGKKKSFSLIYIAVEGMNFAGKKEKRGSDNDFIAYLESLKDVMVFCRFAKEIVIIAEDFDNLEAVRKDIIEKFAVEWKKKGNKYSKADWYIVKDASFVEDANTLIYLLEYAKHHDKDADSDGLINIDEALFAKMVEQKVVEEMIEDAMKNDRVEVFYQPIFSTEANRFVSAEALARLYDDQGKLIPPAVFIGVAEENGMIIKLGEIIFEKVCQFIKSEEFKGLGIEYIEINLSVVQCASEHLADDFKAIMERYEVEPRYINLEITESASIQGKNTLERNMNELIDYGVRFSLDDFGTGNSNLSYIAEMPVDIVKFDRGMINAYFIDKKVKYVMDAAMSMIKGMELEIVSEGIETREQYDTMAELGIQYIQGYYFSKPLPRNEFIQYIRESQRARI